MYDRRWRKCLGVGRSELRGGQDVPKRATAKKSWEKNRQGGELSDWDDNESTVKREQGWPFDDKKT